MAAAAVIFKRVPMLRSTLPRTGGILLSPGCGRAPSDDPLTPGNGISKGVAMSTTVVTLWLLNILLDTFGQLSFKAAAGAADLGEGLARWKAMARRPWIWCGVVCYVGEFLVWLAFLSLVPLSEGVLLGSINIVAVMIAGRFLFNEKFSVLRTLGILLIAAGVTVVGFG